MAFSGDKPIVESVVYDVSGSAVALVHSSSVNVATQPGVMISGLTDGGLSRLVSVDDQGRLQVATSFTGTVSLDNGASSGDPLFVSGAIHVTNAQVPVTGTVALDRGTSDVNPLWVSGTVSLPSFVTITTTGSLPVSIVGQPITITGSVGISQDVRTVEVGSTSAIGTFIPASTTVVTLATANASRRGMVIYNNSNKAMFVKLGSGASLADFSYKVFSDDMKETNVNYTGLVTAIWASSGTSGAMVTQLT